MFSFRSLTTVFILITQAKVFAKSAVTCSDIEIETTLDFRHANVSESTLQNKTGKLQFDNVGSYSKDGVDTTLNLVVKQVGKQNYMPGNVTQNRKSGDFGMINIDSNDGEGTFDFCFVDSKDKPMTLDAFFFSFYDLDGPKKGLESVELKLKDFTAYYVSTNSSIDIKKTKNGKRITFTATESGTGDDNPKDRNNLSSLQQDRSVVFQMENVDCFQVKLSSKCNKKDGKKCNGGRNFLFAGKANQIVPKCKPTPFPTVQPTKGDNPGVAGDPHFKTWADESYDFHGVCDLVLLKNTIFQNGLGLTIHIRTSRMLSWSFVSVVALRIGEDILEVIGGEKEDNFWINEVKGRNKEVGSNNDEMALVSTLSGYPVYYKEVNGQQREFEIVLGGTEKIKIGTWHSFVRIHLENAKSDHFGKSMGLMGSFSKGVTLARDNVTVLDEFNSFGQEWQVLHSEPKLFRVVEGPQHPTQCEIPSSLALRRRLADSTISLVDARKACADVREDAFDLCLFDVLATNDKMTAGAY